MNILGSLNTQQKEAVEHIDGPIMVVAGPGTGKTQILASRIAYILENTDSSAQNILCLTYTDAGTLAMRKRLVRFIGNEAHRVSIHTFHGFCNRVIQENPAYFNYKNLDPVSDLERIEFLTTIAQHLAEDHPLKKMKGNVSYLVGTLSQLFDWMKKENVSASDIEELAKTRRTEMREGDEFRYKRKYKEFNAGDLNTKKLEEAERKLNDLVAASKLFNDYQSVMAENNKYDYADMILWVIDLFTNQPNALSNYQELFHYTLVDEYQDTSGSQNALLSLLINYWDKPNVFVVGDDDQSIYRFQGAEIKNVIDFVDAYSPHLKSVLLTENYRSTQPILDAAKSIIDQNSERLVNLTPGIHKKLNSQRDKSSLGSLVKLVELENEYLQAFWIVQEITRMITQGVSPSEIAVIYVNHQHGQMIAKLLKHHKTPVFLKRSDNILESRSVQKIQTFLTYIEKEIRYPFSGEFELFELLHFEHFEIKPLQLAKLSFYLNKHRQEYKNWRTFLSELKSIPASDLGLAEPQRNHIYTVSEKIENLIQLGANESVFSLASALVHHMGIGVSALNQSQYTFELESIISFLNFAEGEASRDRELNLKSLLEKIRLMNHHRIPISKEHVVYDNNGVNLLTAHASKGLEFRHVFLIHGVQSVWEKRRKRSMPFGLQKLFATNRNDSDLEEIRRLFYVAMTRAEETLHLTYFTKDKAGKEIARSEFLDLLAAESSTQELIPTLDAVATAKSMSAIFVEAEIDQTDILNPPFLDEYLQHYKLSASHLNNYLECATKFYFQNILRVPAAKNVYMSFGIAIHNSLDQILKILKEQSEEFTSKKLMELYEFYLRRERPVFNEKEFEDFMTLGRSILAEYFKVKSDLWKSVEKIETEVMVDRVEVNGVPIKGQLDRLEITGKMVKVIDYKTGDAKNGLKKMKPPIENASEEDTIDKRYGGSYWRQIMFYSLLVNQDKTRDYKMVSGEMDFVEPVGPEEFLAHKVMITPENEAIMSNMVVEVYGKIQNREFLNGCQKPDCYWCNFVANYYGSKNATN